MRATALLNLGLRSLRDAGVRAYVVYDSANQPHAYERNGVEHSARRKLAIRTGGRGHSRLSRVRDWHKRYAFDAALDKLKVDGEANVGPVPDAERLRVQMALLNYANHHLPFKVGTKCNGKYLRILRKPEKQ